MILEQEPMKKLVVAILFARIVLPAAGFGAEAQRPRLLGLSQAVVRCHDLNACRHFYHDLLGFDEAFAIRKDQTAVVTSGLSADQVSAVFFKVNIRQYIVVMPETTPNEPRFVRYAVETDNVEAMRLFLKSLGYHVPAKVTKTPTYDLAFDVDDPDGMTIEVVQYTPESLSVKNAERFLSPNRLSARMLHVGFTITKPETAKFYQQGFSVREFWRSDRSMHAPARANGPAQNNRANQSQSRPAVATGPLLATLSNLKMPEGDDYIEWSFSREPAAARRGGHIALLTADMAKTVAAIEARPAFKGYTRQHEAHVGINHKWQGNFFDPDGTRTEFMELDTADGMPSPMSHAPWF